MSSDSEIFLEGQPANDSNTLVFDLKAECKRTAKSSMNSQVLADQLVWLPRGEQLDRVQNSEYLEKSQFCDFWKAKAEANFHRQATHRERVRSAPLSSSASNIKRKGKNVSFADEKPSAGSKKAG